MSYVIRDSSNINFQILYSELDGLTVEDIETGSDTMFTFTRSSVLNDWAFSATDQGRSIDGLSIDDEQFKLGLELQNGFGARVRSHESLKQIHKIK